MYSYGIFSVYRDTLLYNGVNLGKMPKDTFTSLLAAPFQWSVMKKPEVWGGILGSLSIAVGVAYFTYSESEASMSRDTQYVFPLSAVPIAIGEESLFRGFLQSGVLRDMPAWGAITFSSLAFGAAHIPNAWSLNEADQIKYYAVSVPLITAFGAYMGWLTYKNRSLKESVAVHAWYDGTLFLMGALATASIKEQRGFSYSFAF